MIIVVIVLIVAALAGVAVLDTIHSGYRKRAKIAEARADHAEELVDKIRRDAVENCDVDPYARTVLDTIQSANRQTPRKDLNP